MFWRHVPKIYPARPGIGGIIYARTKIHFVINSRWTKKSEHLRTVNTDGQFWTRLKKKKTKEEWRREEKSREKNDKRLGNAVLKRDHNYVTSSCSSETVVNDYVTAFWLCCAWYHDSQVLRSPTGDDIVSDDGRRCRVSVACYSHIIAVRYTWGNVNIWWVLVI